ncbi:hypothetical protein [Streptomyces sp. NPDC051909]|uniref:hypothetical protein n=1 Tax=Streptomyces sp. NPDC051909 TaxID=3154944 RepID=UPI0034282DB9
MIGVDPEERKAYTCFNLTYYGLMRIAAGEDVHSTVIDAAARRRLGSFARSSRPAIDDPLMASDVAGSWCQSVKTMPELYGGWER